MMLTANARATATNAANNDGRPATKRARGEMLTARSEGEGNRATRATSVTNGKRARDISLNSPLSPFSPNTVLLQPAVPRAVPEHVREPARRTTRSSAVKAPSSSKVCVDLFAPQARTAHHLCLACARNQTSTTWCLCCSCGRSEDRVA